MLCIRTRACIAPAQWSKVLVASSDETGPTTPRDRVQSPVCCGPFGDMTFRDDASTRAPAVQAADT